MTFFILHALMLVLPGWLMTALMRRSPNRALLIPAFSYALLMFNLLALRTMRLPPAWFVPLLALQLALLGAAVILRMMCTEGFRRVSGARPRGLLPPLLALVGAMALGLIYSGVYLEVPADVLEHLRRFNVHLYALQANAFDPEPLRHLWLRQGHLWYFIPALSCHLTGMTVRQAAPYIAAVNSLVFVVAVYCFGLKIFAGLRFNTSVKARMAALAGFFFVVHAGISAFAYFRYYTLAPTMAAYPVYLACAALLLDFLRAGRPALKHVWPLALFLPLLNILHTQEALFVFFIALGMGLAECIRRRSKPAWRPAPVLLAATGAAYLLLFVISRLRPVSPLWVYAAVPIEHLLPFLRNMAVQLPTDRFYQVVTVWGAWVYMLFAVYRRELWRQPFIAAGMFMPLLTVFNPVTVDIMLRNLPDPLALYRFNFMLPLPFVAGYCGIRTWREFRRRPAVWRRTWCVAVWAGLILLLLPLDTAYFIARYSRLPTLRRVRAENSLEYWGDLLDFLDGCAPAVVITDPVTAYMVRGVTRHEAGGLRFYYSGFSWWLNPENPEIEPQDICAHLNDSNRWLLVVNLRDGAASETGRIAGHWPEDVLNLTDYYAPRILDWVAARPDIFELVWERDRARVYTVNPAAVRP